MSLERFPVKEKLATDLDSQIAWLVREMGYSRDKTKGYEEKLVRLARSPAENESIFGFMEGYWFRFRRANEALAAIPTQLMVNRALQANAKDAEWLLETALFSVKECVNLISGDYSDEELLGFVAKPFEENPMGSAILRLHESYAHDPHDVESLHDIALEGAAAGVVMWQAYARSLERQGFSVEMPKPGLPSGNIEAWD